MSISDFYPRSYGSKTGLVSQTEIDDDKGESFVDCVVRNGVYRVAKGKTHYDAITKAWRQTKGVKH